MSLLESIHDPADLRKLPRAQLNPLADELRAFLLDSVSKTGGHLGSNLGTVWGPVFGAILYFPVQDQLTRVVSDPYLPSLLYGVLLIVIVMFEPLGIAGVLGRGTKYARALIMPKDGEP